MSNWFQQTLGNTGNWLKQTAGKVSNGIQWLHQNIVEPGVKIGKQFGGDIGKFADGVGQASSAVNDVNQSLRNGTANLNGVKRSFDELHQGIEKGRSSAGGAIHQAKKVLKKGPMKF